jgi:hypothetical protein
MYRAIPGEKIVEEDRENQHGGEFGGLRSPYDFHVGGARLVLQEKVNF